MNELEEFYLSHKKIFEYALYQIRTEKYLKKEITKKSGGIRELNIPPRFAKIVQKKLNAILQKKYIPPKAVHGFVKSQKNYTKNIISNSKQHIKKAIVINVDIDNFFDTINFGRVRGLFLKQFKVNEKIATRLTQLIVFDNRLPQGAPTSPIISNLICKKMDNNLIQLAKKHSLTYTRYADDITFSSHKKDLNDKLILKEIEQIIINNGFKINPSKTRIQYSNQTQIVTGLKVNQKVNIDRKYIRQIRSMLYSWYKDGLIEATNKHFSENINNYNKKQKKYYSNINENNLKNIVFSKINFLKQVIKNILSFFYKNELLKTKTKNFINLKYNQQPNKYSDTKENSFKNILIGKINFLGQVKGKENPLYLKFRQTYYLLNDNFILERKLNEFEELDINNLKVKEVSTIFTQIYNSILIFTEGETDIVYIKSALKYFQNQNKFKDMKLRFCNLRGWVNVKNMHQVFYKKTTELSIINLRKCIEPHNITQELKFCFILDSDDTGIVNYFTKQKHKNYFLIDKDKKGYIEKLIDKNLIIQIINNNNSGNDIDPNKAKDKTKKLFE